MTDPTLGIWISEEGEVGAPDPRNLYRFVGDNPTNETDPTGLSSKNNNNGPNNAKKVMDMLVKKPNGSRFWLVVFRGTNKMWRHVFNVPGHSAR